MVRSRPDDGNNAFSIDDDEDMDLLLEAAANAGSAASDEQDNVPFDDGLNISGDPIVSSKPADEIDFGISDDEPAPQRPTPVSVREPIEEADSGVGDEIDALLETINLQQPVSEPVIEREPEPIRTFEPEPVYVATPPVPSGRRAVPEPVREPEPIAQPAVKHQLAPTPKSMTLAEQIILAQRIVATVDVYRGLTNEAKDLVAQLLSPNSEDFSQDEGTVAIRAIYAEPIQESTQKALIESKNASPVDRVFYVLGLPKDVLRYLGELVQAYSGEELPSDGNQLKFAKALVEAIENLDGEPIVYAEAMAKVLGAAQKK